MGFDETWLRRRLRSRFLRLLEAQRNAVMVEMAEAWYRDEPPMPLCQWLCMSWQEYRCWTEGP